MEIQKLKKWFLQHKRKLPWRENPTPYEVWVSEVMLQQTQVSVVIEYYEKWMELFPTLESLAKAPLETVIKAWEGLGYYSRARRLHEAAKQLVNEQRNTLPSDERELMKIKGFGPYTVGAILSFAYHQKKAAVDGNVLRVMARHEGIKEEISRAGVIKKIRELVEQLLPEEEPWVVMEAFIELGALVCKKKPVCGLCPLRLSCNAYEHQEQHLYPFKRQNEGKAKVTKLYRSVAIIQSEEYVLLRRETEQHKLMADLWEFPYFEEEAPIEEAKLPRCFLENFSKALEFRSSLPLVKQTFTRYHAALYPSLWHSHERPIIPGYHWILLTELSQYPFSSGHKKILSQTSLFFNSLNV